MRLRFLILLFALFTPAICSAQQAALDDLLPASSQLYFRFDGVEPHKEAAAKLAVVKMWNGDTGKFLKGAWKYVEDLGKQELSKELNAELASAVFDEFAGLVTSVNKNGFALGVEVQSILPFKAQATLAFENGNGPAKSPMSFMNTMARLNKEVKVQSTKQGDRTVNFVHAEPVYLIWWAEGKNAVWSVGTTEPTALLKGLEGQDKLSKHPLYKQVQEFKEFTTWSRGYLDLPTLLRMGNAHPAVPQFAGVLGLDTIKSMTFFSGFDGAAERAVSFTNLEKGPRKGLFKLLGKKAFSLKDLPPMPQDLNGFSAASVDINGAYDLGIDVAENIIKMFAPPGGAPNVKQMIADLEQKNNISISGMFGALDELYVAYAASPEGFLGLGQTQLIKVKDGKKLEDELGKIARAIENQAAGLMTLKATDYHGAKINTFMFNSPNGVAIQSISFTIHKGWLAIAQYPQPLMGYILRANNELPSWKADKELVTRLAPFPKEFTGITVSDPRPGIKLVLSVLPPAIAIGETFLHQMQANQGKAPLKKFDLTLIPNAYEATQHLFPNIVVSTDEGERLRSETRASLMFPF